MNTVHVLVQVLQSARNIISSYHGNGETIAPIELPMMDTEASEAEIIKCYEKEVVEVLNFVPPPNKKSRAKYEK